MPLLRLCIEKAGNYEACDGDVYVDKFSSIRFSDSPGSSSEVAHSFQVEVNDMKLER